MIRTLREAPRSAPARCTHVDVPLPPGVLAHRADDRPAPWCSCTTWPTSDGHGRPGRAGRRGRPTPTEVLGRPRLRPAADLAALALAGYGYRWIRLRRAG